MKMPKPIQTKTDFFFIEPQTTNRYINKIFKNWYKNRLDYFINNKDFNEYYYLYKMNERDSYTNTRIKRFQTFINNHLIKQFHNSENEITTFELTQQLLQLLDHVIINDYWLQTLENRLSSRSYIIDGSTSHKVYLQELPNKQIELQILFTVSGTAIWHNMQWEEEDLQDPRQIIIAEKDTKLFSGKSIIVLEEEKNNNQFIIKSKYAQASLFATAMRPAFIEPTLDEQINSHLLSLDKIQNPEEEKILIAVKKYYLNKLPAQSLKNIFISTNFYNEEFKTSKSYQLIKKILEEKPIPGFNL